MDKLTIAYWGMSDDYSAAGDRRRFAGFALRNEIVLSSPESVGQTAAVVTLGSDISQWKKIKNQNGVLILDIVDSYLDETCFSPKRILRGVYKSANGQLASKHLSYSNLLKDVIAGSDAVVCASIEQREKLLRLNPNVHAIVDCFDEVFDDEPRKGTDRSNASVMWEGFPDNLKHLRILNISNPNLNFEIVSLLKMRRIVNLNRETETDKYLKRLRINYELTPWTLKNLKDTARRSMAGVIPIDVRSPMAWNKSENKLLGMWSLGLPVFTSPTPSYSRVMNEAKLSECLVANIDWNQRLSNFVNQSATSNEIARIGYNFAKTRSSSFALDKLWENLLHSVGIYK